MVDSIIFDLDGTLWDPTETVVGGWNHVIKGYLGAAHEITIENLQGIMGLPVPEVGRKLFPDTDEDTRQKIMDECCDMECLVLSQQGGRLYARVEEVLQALSAKYKLFIVSNCQTGYIEAFYEYHGLQKYFTDYENPGRTGLSKGENIRLVMDRNHLMSAVYVGDTEGDRKAAGFAGIPFVYAGYGFGEVGSYDYVIDRLDGILDLF
ncbi:HAD family hydrolase [Paenibacillus sp. FSL K6-1217]|uniref:HAD family hydrolase n=1 Tax=Paenibacillus sp. FSL K6-1217 TaxID=2921466 RepID=UPI0032549A8C